MINGRIQHFDKISADQDPEDMRIKLTNQKDGQDKTVSFSREDCVEMEQFPGLLANDIVVVKGLCLLAFAESSCRGADTAIKAKNLVIHTNISNGGGIASAVKSVQSCCQNLGLSFDNEYVPYDFSKPVHRMF